MKKTETVTEQVRLGGGFKSGGRIRVADCLRQIVPKQMDQRKKTIHHQIQAHLPEIVPRLALAIFQIGLLVPWPSGATPGRCREQAACFCTATHQLPIFVSNVSVRREWPLRVLTSRQ